MTSAAVVSAWIVPSARRPHNARELAAAWESAATSLSTGLILAVDDDDPDLPGYEQVAVDHPWITLAVIQDSPHQIGPILNQVARDLLDLDTGPPPDLIGFMGDDHRPRTLHWDRELAAALARDLGVAYGNDLNQAEKLPTACLISAPVVAALGYLVPPGLDHLYLDDFWLQLGCATHLAYRPGVIIEHLHPTVGKAEFDQLYAAKGMNPDLFQRDGEAYRRYLGSQEWEQVRNRLAALRPEAARAD